MREIQFPAKMVSREINFAYYQKKNQNNLTLFNKFRPTH